MIVYPSTVVKESLLEIDEILQVWYVCFFFPGTASTQCLAEEIIAIKCVDDQIPGRAVSPSVLVVRQQTSP